MPAPKRKRLVLALVLLLALLLAGVWAWRSYTRAYDYYLWPERGYLIAVERDPGREPHVRVTQIPAFSRQPVEPFVDTAIHANGNTMIVVGERRVTRTGFLEREVATNSFRVAFLLSDTDASIPDVRFVRRMEVEDPADFSTIWDEEPTHLTLLALPPGDMRALSQANSLGDYHDALIALSEEHPDHPIMRIMRAEQAMRDDQIGELDDLLREYEELEAPHPVDERAYAWYREARERLLRSRREPTILERIPDEAPLLQGGSTHLDLEEGNAFLASIDYDDLFTAPHVDPGEDIRYSVSMHVLMALLNRRQVEVDFALISGTAEEPDRLVHENFRILTIMARDSPDITRVVSFARLGVIVEGARHVYLSGYGDADRLAEAIARLDIALAELESAVDGPAAVANFTGYVADVDWPALPYALAQMRLLREATEVRLFQLREGRLPESRAELTASGWEALVDPFAPDGRAMTYIRRDDAVVLYSWGLNRIDNRGTREATLGDSDDKDIVVEIPEVRRYDFPASPDEAPRTVEELRARFPHGLPPDPFGETPTYRVQPGTPLRIFTERMRYSPGAVDRELEEGEEIGERAFWWEGETLWVTDGRVIEDEWGPGPVHVFSRGVITLELE